MFGSIINRIPSDGVYRGPPGPQGDERAHSRAQQDGRSKAPVAPKERQSAHAERLNSTTEKKEVRSNSVREQEFGQAESGRQHAELPSTTKAEDQSSAGSLNGWFDTLQAMGMTPLTSPASAQGRQQESAGCPPRTRVFLPQESGNREGSYVKHHCRSATPRGRSLFLLQWHVNPPQEKRARHSVDCQ